MKLYVTIVDLELCVNIMFKSFCGASASAFVRMSISCTRDDTQSAQNAHAQIYLAVQPTTAAPSALAERQKKSIFWTTFYDHAPLKCESVVEELRRGGGEEFPFEGGNNPY